MPFFRNLFRSFIVPEAPASAEPTQLPEGIQIDEQVVENVPVIDGLVNGMLPIDQGCYLTNANIDASAAIDNTQLVTADGSLLTVNTSGYLMYSANTNYCVNLGDNWQLVFNSEKRTIELKEDDKVVLVVKRGDGFWIDPEMNPNEAANKFWQGFSAVIRQGGYR